MTGGDRPQEPLAVKGVDTPVQSYLVRRPKPRQFRIGTCGIEGVATRMIGRDAELELLQTAFKRLWLERKLAAVKDGEAHIAKLLEPVPVALRSARQRAGARLEGHWDSSDPVSDRLAGTGRRLHSHEPSRSRDRAHCGCVDLERST
jgi:hypothetical protein